MYRYSFDKNIPVGTVLVSIGCLLTLPPYRFSRLIPEIFEFFDVFLEWDPLLPFSCRQSPNILSLTVHDYKANL